MAARFSPSILLGEVTQPTDSRLSETTCMYELTSSLHVAGLCIMTRRVSLSLRALGNNNYLLYLHRSHGHGNGHGHGSHSMAV